MNLALPAEQDARFQRIMAPVSTAALVLPLDDGVVPGGRALEPVLVEIARVCHFKRKACGLCGLPKSNTIHRKKNEQEGKPFCAFGRRNGCEHCGLPMSHACHLGAPDSFNVMAGRDPNVYRSILDRWAPVLMAELEASGLPKGLGYVLVEGEVSFGDAVDRDAGNHRVMLEKALGDALVRGGWLRSDTWARYEFGGLQRREQRGVSRTRLTLFPRA